MPSKEIKKYSLPLGANDLRIELRDLASQASGSAVVIYGDTMVHATAVMAKKEREGLDFFPLMVDYEEKYYAAGKIKGPRFIRRETRPSDEAVCNARLIDRTIRPLFPDGVRKDVQTIATVLAWDGANEPDTVGLIGISCALAISDIPWRGPVGAVRVGFVDGQYILNPTYEQRAKSALDVVFSGIERKGDIIINMIEGGFNQVEERLIVDAFKFAKPYLKQIIDFQIKIAAQEGKTKKPLIEPAPDPTLERDLKDRVSQNLEGAMYTIDKIERQEKMEAVREQMRELVETSYPGDAPKLRYGNSWFEQETDRILHENILKNGKRPDGRAIDGLRELSGEVGLLARTHGSALFVRGETKSLSVVTLGAPGDQQIMDGMEITGKKRFLHHYNFPPYSVGEVKPLRAPGRREIGHGMLAEKALIPLLPPVEEFPYTIRVASEIMSSNGSSSMAALTAASMALMDAGVPMKAAATGISMGMVTDSAGNYKILTDIQGPEDHHGDMDFKVAGTRAGVNAIQMDVKIDGITEKMLAEILERGKTTRHAILDAMEKVIAAPRPELSPYAPRIIIIHINPEKIRDVIGPGGKMINEIIDETGVLIDIEDDGTVFITADKLESGKKAVEWIQNLTREVQVGETFQGTVRRIMAFGAFVEILPGSLELGQRLTRSLHDFRRVKAVKKMAM